MYANTEGEATVTTVRRWDVATRRQELRTTVPPVVDSLAVPEEGGPVTLSGTPWGLDESERRVDVWRVAGGTRAQVLGRRTSALSSVVTPDGRAVLMWNGELVDLRTGGSAGVLRGEGEVEGAAYSPDGRLLAVVDDRGEVTLWNARGTRPLGILMPGSYDHRAGGPPLLVFSEDGRELALGREDGTVHVWETDTPRLSGAEYPGADGPVLALGFAGGTLRVTTPRTAVRELPLEPKRAAAAACRRAGGGLTRAQWRAYAPGLSFRATC
ncbi:hypothetical protein [Streptomyces sp. CC224B]|uniref:WD40 repeat domain-containing protein n=1 Tax=Streptomyces sp. CC224B TaxID=3044571 RepID=UPI0024A8F8B4|nr:hypothetical protein [Streptomyces sp. CC224B]